MSFIYKYIMYILVSMYILVTKDITVQSITTMYVLALHGSFHLLHPNPSSHQSACNGFTCMGCLKIPRGPSGTCHSKAKVPRASIPLTVGVVATFAGRSPFWAEKTGVLPVFFRKTSGVQFFCGLGEPFYVLPKS